MEVSSEKHWVFFCMCIQAWLLGWGVSILLSYEEMQKCPGRLRCPNECLGRKVNTTAILVIFIVWFVFTSSLKSKFWVNEQR